MQHFIWCILVSLHILMGAFSANAQESIYFDNGMHIHVFEQDSVGIFANVLSKASLETEVGADVVFFGERWKNDSTSRYPGNGRFTFEQPSVLGLNVTQKLGGALWSNRFPNFILRNPNDLSLFGLAGNRDTFRFDTGCVLQNKNDYVIGNSTTGVILGYKETKFFVTNHDNSSDSGFLVRHAVGAIAADFPVGNAKSDYTPARIVNSGVIDTFAVRVFPNVYVEGNLGIIENDVTVQRTWNILEQTPGGSSVTLTLQHNAATEGSLYSRSDQYISRYFGQSNKAYLDTSLGSFWDYAAAGNGYGNSAGSITTGSSVGFQATRSLPITSNFGKTDPTRYFTKASTIVPVPVELLFLTASWRNNETDANISWATATEINNMGFEILRSYDRENWSNIDFVLSRAESGNSNSVLDYSYIDTKISKTEHQVFYKLKQIDFDGSFEEFGPTILQRTNASVPLTSLLYPNPSKGEFNIMLEGDLKGDLTIEIVNMLGQNVHSQLATKINYADKITVENSYLRHGTYYVLIKSNSNLIIKPIKLLISK